MKTIQDFVACVRRQQLFVRERFGKPIERMLITYRVPSGSTVVSHAQPTVIVVNDADVMRLAVVGEPIKNVTLTFMGLPVRWDKQ